MDLQLDEVAANVVTAISADDIFVSKFIEELKPEMENIFIEYGQRNVIVKEIYRNFNQTQTERQQKNRDPRKQIHDEVFDEVIKNLFKKGKTMEM